MHVPIAIYLFLFVSICKPKAAALSMTLFVSYQSKYHRQPGTAIAVLSAKTSTLRQNHNFISIDLTFGVADYVREVTSLAKFFGSDKRSRRHVGATYGSCDFFVFVFLFFNRATAHTSEPIIAYNSSKDAVWCKEDPFGDEKCVILKFGGVLP